MDSHGIFNGSDEKAAKLAGNDLKGLIAYENCAVEDIHLPFTTIVDFLGFRGNKKKRGKKK